MIFIVGNAKFSMSDKKSSDRLVENWNKAVGRGDMVIHIGEFAKDNIEYFQSVLNGLTVYITNSSNSDLKGTKFKNLFLYDDLTFSQRKNPDKKVLCVLNTSAENLTDSNKPEVVGEADSDWTHKYAGQRIVGHDYMYLLKKTVINVDQSLWKNTPVPFTEILRGITNG